VPPTEQMSLDEPSIAEKLLNKRSSTGERLLESQWMVETDTRPL
jgi:hypothetical protein